MLPNSDAKNHIVISARRIVYCVRGEFAMLRIDAPTRCALGILFTLTASLATSSVRAAEYGTGPWIKGYRLPDLLRSFCLG